MTYFTRAAGPLGEMLLTSDGAALTGLFLNDPTPAADAREDAGPFAEVLAQLAAYFAGTLTRFTVPLRLGGTPFQRSAWALLRDIPHGETISYAEQARRLGMPTASRAVGGANGRNPVCVVVPCHRVVASGGGLGGYAGGLERKRWLLAFEAHSVSRAGTLAGLVNAGRQECRPY